MSDEPREVGGYLIKPCSSRGPSGSPLDPVRGIWCFAMQPERPHWHYVNSEPIRDGIKYARCTGSPLTCLPHGADCPPRPQPISSPFD